MKRYTLSFQEIGKSDLFLVGGKGANLGELTRAGFPVPAGFCVTTRAFDRFIANSSEMKSFYEQLKQLDVENIAELKKIGETIRTHLHNLPFPEEIASEVLFQWRKLGEEKFYAIRSSATAEDLPTASFAGQQETYLNVAGEENILHYIQKCWASLFTDRAIAYRSKNGYEHEKVALSVVVQPMVFPEVSGIMFTADPVNGNRKIISIDASFGLGEALVSGLVSPDLYKVKNEQIQSKKIGDKKIALYSHPEGGIIQQEISKERTEKPALTDEQILTLAKLGKEIEKHFQGPQDIEWALMDGQFYILQSRPITSLYPVPKVKDDRFLHVFISFGHQQMMTEAMKPMGISIMKTFFPFGKKEENRETHIMSEAGNRIFVDLTYLFHRSFLREKLPLVLNNMDSFIASAVSEVANREEFLQGVKYSKGVGKKILSIVPRIAGKVFYNYFFLDVTRVKERTENYISSYLKSLQSELFSLSGAIRLRRMQERIVTDPINFFYKLFVVAITGISSYHAVRILLEKWLGDSKCLTHLGKSLHGNITLEMGLLLGDIGDVARKFPAVVSYLRNPDENNYVADLRNIEGGEEFLRSFNEYLEKYGMRCPGEIDLTQTRWMENPVTLFPAIVGHIDSTEPGEHRQKFKQGEMEREKASREILSRLKEKSFGSLKSKIMTRLLNVFTYMMALREHPKYMIINCFWIYKRIILEEAGKLVEKNVLREVDDVYFLRLSELISIVEGSFTEDVQQLIAQRKEEYGNHKNLTPPRVITSEGEMIKSLNHTKNIPPGAIPGTPVSSGVVEGRARVVLKPEEGKLEKGDILIAPFTDPGWTPLFISAKGLVMEVGGLMTHGAVVAREYGIPAVVGVENATKMIKDGQRVRVHGDLGFVEILD